MLLDNYAYLVTDRRTDTSVVIDPGHAEPVQVNHRACCNFLDNKIEMSVGIFEVFPLWNEVDETVEQEIAS